MMLAFGSACQLVPYAPGQVNAPSPPRPIGVATGADKAFIEEVVPALIGAALPADHVFGHGRLGEFEAQFQQFAMDARRAPERVFKTDPADQSDALRIEPRAAAALP